MAAQPVPHKDVADAELVTCIRDGSLTAARALLRAGRNANARGQGGWTALHWAANEDLVRLLVGHGAEVNAVDRGGHTALYHASEVGQDRTVRLLRRLGARG